MTGFKNTAMLCERLACARYKFGFPTQGDFGTPRPALVIQADQFSEHPSVTVLPVTSTLLAALLLRITVNPGAENGLQKPSQVMIDKPMAVKRDKVGPAIGRIDADTMIEVERSLAVFLGIAK